MERLMKSDIHNERYLYKTIEGYIATEHDGIYAYPSKIIYYILEYRRIGKSIMKKYSIPKEYFSFIIYCKFNRLTDSYFEIKDSTLTIVGMHPVVFTAKNVIWYKPISTIPYIKNADTNYITSAILKEVTHNIQCKINKQKKYKEQIINNLNEKINYNEKLLNDFSETINKLA